MVTTSYLLEMNAVNKSQDDDIIWWVWSLLTELF